MTIIDYDQLLESAKDFTRRALKAYAENDHRVVLIQAAFSLEHLAKAYLCSVSPAYLVELKNGQFDSLLHLTGQGGKAKKLRSPRTISAREALNRVEQLLPGLAVPRNRLDQLIDIRDGVVHVGYLQDRESREIFTAMLRFSKDLYDALGVPSSTRWSSHGLLVASLISESLTEIEREVQQKLASARLSMSDLLSKIPEKQHSFIMAARQAQGIAVANSSEEQVKAKCPACGDGAATCMGEPEIFWNPNWGIGTKVIHARSFFCGACDLVLIGPDQLKAAGLQTRIELAEEVDQDDRSD